MLKLVAGYDNGVLHTVVEYGPQTCTDRTLEQAIKAVQEDCGGPLVLANSWEDLDAFEAFKRK